MHQGSTSNTPIPIAIIGAGPAGLMAAEVLSAAGICVHVYDAMPSVGRKFLLAGIGGLNLTHAEPFEVFTTAMAIVLPHAQHGCRALMQQPCVNGPKA